MITANCTIKYLKISLKFKNTNFYQVYLTLPLWSLDQSDVAKLRNQLKICPKKFNKEEDWKKAMAKKCPQFRYCASVLDLELVCLRLVGAFREADFNMYLQSIRKLLPWMLVLDHGNYARWLSVHYCDMCILSPKHLDMYNYFQEGYSTIHKTSREFSSTALDHAHEQVIAAAKSDGGNVGLTENPAALRRWMVADPEIARMIQEFEADSSTTDEYDHYEQKKGIQNVFEKDVNTISSFEELGNPFKEEGLHLMALHTKEIMDDSVI